jgi:hypothetical protein
MNVDRGNRLEKIIVAIQMFSIVNTIMEVFLSVCFVDTGAGTLMVFLFGNSVKPTFQVMGIVFLFLFLPLLWLLELVMNIIM